jgi:hypothetical protein
MCGDMKRIRVGGREHFTHFLFVNDLPLFTMYIVGEGFHLKEILSPYNKATRMEINVHKYSKSYNGIEEGTIHGLDHLFSHNTLDLDEGIKYLGFILKPNRHV